MADVMNVTGNFTNGSENFYDKLNTQSAGWVAIVICSICFGTNLIPVKKFKMGDGMAFQWLMCTGIFVVGVVVQLAIGFAYRIPKFHPLAMLGGALWATGNSMTVVIIEAIGLALGILIWSIANMLMGFFSSRFGFGILIPKEPKNPTLNYIGVAIAVVSISLYAFIKPNTSEEKTEDNKEEDLEDGMEEEKCISQLPVRMKKFVGFFLAIIAGFFYGTNFMPVIYVQQQPGNSQAGLDYVFAHFLGIWLTSTIIFVIYALVKKNSLWLPSNQAILPSLLSGILWAIAQSSWFVANATLGEPVTFPVVTTCPAVIATVVSVGKKNYIILGCAICVTFVGIIINALSMIDFS
ncbi:unnamed protein product [Rodentolepis nana]|uniref:Transmembrane protein 144 n=1 Tax=Rodentolepis nana TaxID=102285 RepID=A0A0R3TZ56_RODNA|nr:unnamed protein product [Rodentolepis nana]